MGPLFLFLVRARSADLGVPTIDSAHLYWAMAGLAFSERRTSVLVEPGVMVMSQDRAIWKEDAMPGVAVITEACIDVKDRVCVDVCPLQCIYEFDPQKNILFYEEVVTAFNQPGVCLVGAIYSDDHLPNGSATSAGYDAK